MKKVLALLCVGLVAAFFAGCSDSKSPTSPPANSISFSNLAMTPDTLYAVASFFGNVSGTMTGTSTITSCSLTVHDKTGSDMSAKFMIRNTAVQNKVVDLKADAGARIMALSTAAVGKYYLIITAMIGSQSFTDSIAFTVSLQPDLYFDSVVAGSGNSIDLDWPATYTDSTSAATLPTIDLCYANCSGVAGIPDGDYLFSPDQAQASGLNFASTWTGTPNSTAFYKVQNFTGAGFDTVYSKSQVAALWNPANPTPYALCAQGDVFIARTDQNVYVLIYISSQTPGAAGTISMKIAD